MPMAYLPNNAVKRPPLLGWSGRASLKGQRCVTIQVQCRSCSCLTTVIAMRELGGKKKAPRENWEREGARANVRYQIGLGSDGNFL